MWTSPGMWGETKFGLERWRHYLGSKQVLDKRDCANGKNKSVLSGVWQKEIWCGYPNLTAYATNMLGMALCNQSRLTSTSTLRGCTSYICHAACTRWGQALTLNTTENMSSLFLLSKSPEGGVYRTIKKHNLRVSTEDVTKSSLSQRKVY